MTTRMREGFGVLCVGLICFLIGYVVSSNTEGTTARLFDVIQAAGGLFVVGGLALVAWDLLRKRDA